VQNPPEFTAITRPRKPNPLLRLGTLLRGMSIRRRTLPHFGGVLGVQATLDNGIPPSLAPACMRSYKYERQGIPDRERGLDPAAAGPAGLASPPRAPSGESSMNGPAPYCCGNAGTESWTPDCPRSSARSVDFLPRPHLARWPQSARRVSRLQPTSLPRSIGSCRDRKRQQSRNPQRLRRQPAHS